MDYLSTLSKHTQAVNVVRWAPKGKLLLASHPQAATWPHILTRASPHR